MYSLEAATVSGDDFSRRSHVCCNRIARDSYPVRLGPRADLSLPGLIRPVSHTDPMDHAGRRQRMESIPDHDPNRVCCFHPLDCQAYCRPGKDYTIDNTAANSLCSARAGADKPDICSNSAATD